MYTNLKPGEYSQVADTVKNYKFSSKITKIQKNLDGDVNKIFLLTAGSKKLILRESQPKKSLQHLQLEVAVLEYLRSKKFPLTPRLVANKHGELITKHHSCFYLLQTLVPGTTKTSWNNLENFSLRRLKNFFSASAQFTKTVAKFPYQTTQNNRPLFYYVRNGNKLLASLHKQTPQGKARQLLDQNKKSITDKIAKLKLLMEQANYDQLPKQLVHFDFHPGNVHFIGNQISGIFDLDWVRFDTRITDLAGTIAQSCYNFTGKNRAKYRQDRIQAGLQAYRKAYEKSEFSVKEENYLLRLALPAYVFYQLLWSIDYDLRFPSKKGYNYIDFFIRLLNNDYEQLFS